MRPVRRGALTTLLLGLALLVAGPAGAQVGPGQTFTGTVTGAVDGDTFHVWRSAGDTVTVHLWGVDAPEPGQTYGAATTRAVRHYVTDKSVWVSVETVDRRGRAVARIEVRGKALSKMLLRRGLVWHSPRQAPDANSLKRLERRARTAGRGLWSQPTPTPPWEWRERRGTAGKSDG
ncbi:MAG: hypothetical protein BRD30_02220 [Bacteroidetes bacterium QH_2_63_10]|jgi:endonuclease YncB( thermonuclease family)|nr:MAG: hypothetical protein BRD30_02220 [Bacteroidetes bacterium QH_2_63_10]